MKPFFFSRLVMAAVSLSFVPFENAQADAKPGSWRGQSLTEFDNADNEKFGWRIVNDGVMGGLSEGNMAMSEDGKLTFHGDLSLKNNGGFSMVQSRQIDFNLSNDLGLLLLVKGDGRTYDARLDSDALYRGRPVSFSGKIKTTKDKWVQVKVPFAEFKGGWRGVNLPDKKLNPSVITKLAVLLGDKKEGPFHLEIDWIRTYGKGQGNYVERQTKVEKPAAASSKRLMATIDSDERLTTLKTAFDTAKLTPFFQWDNPLTVFAPSNEAFAKLPDGLLEALLKPESKAKLIALLSHHVTAGNHNLSDALKASQLSPLKGSPVQVSFNQGRATVGQATIVSPDITCYDGIIHVIDEVLVPSGFEL